jgi:2-dehydro-3-deoxygluconokinase
MTDRPPSVICVGEVLIELARGEDGRFSLSCAGDTFNTAVYLARAGIATGYATALGDDPYSSGVLALAAAEGVARDLMIQLPGVLPGLCLIERNAQGERRRLVWNDSAPVRALFELPQWGALSDGLLAARVIYFSGITLSLFSNTGLGRFLALVELARERGAKIVFDGNFRPQGWKGNLDRARTVFMETLRRVDIALPTYHDEALLWGDANPTATAERIKAFGVEEVVIKNGAESALVSTKGATEQVPVLEVVTPVDPAAAGDAFNAGYLAARLTGDKPAAAAALAHRLAGQVIRHPGALMPRAGAAMH